MADIVCQIRKKVKMSNELISKDEITNELVNEIKELIINARNKVAQQVNETLIDTYCNIGEVIVEKEQSGQIKAEYGIKCFKKTFKGNWKRIFKK